MKVVYVDVPPQFPEESEFWLTSQVFYGDSAKEDALEYVQQMFGADEEGKVSLLSFGEDEGE